MPAPGPALRPLHVPAAGAWPPAPGWWVVAAVLLAVGAWAAWRCWRGRCQRRRRRQSTVELDELAERHARDGDTAAFAAGVSALLRRAVRERTPALLRLHGQAWWAALGREAGVESDVETLATLDDAMYRADATLDVERIVAAARRVLRRWFTCQRMRRRQRRV